MTNNTEYEVYCIRCSRPKGRGSYDFASRALSFHIALCSGPMLLGSTAFKIVEVVRRDPHRNPAGERTLTRLIYIDHQPKQTHRTTIDGTPCV